MISEPNITTRLVAVIEGAHCKRRLVAPGDPDEVARLATRPLRRRNSIEQRTKKTSRDAACEEDRAKCLRDALKSERRLVLPLVTG